MNEIREQVFNSMNENLRNSKEFDFDETTQVLKDMIFAEPENPNKFRLEGETTWKEVIDKIYNDEFENKDVEEFVDFVEYRLIGDENDGKKLKELYDTNAPCEFWVRDRYGDSSQIVYTFYDDNLTLEDIFSEMVDF